MGACWRVLADSTDFQIPAWGCADVLDVAVDDSEVAVLDNVVDGGFLGCSLPAIHRPFLRRTELLAEASIDQKLTGEMRRTVMLD